MTFNEMTRCDDEIFFTEQPYGADIEAEIDCVLEEVQKDKADEHKRTDQA